MQDFLGNEIVAGDRILLLHKAAKYLPNGENGKMIRYTGGNVMDIGILDHITEHYVFLQKSDGSIVRATKDYTNVYRLDQGFLMDASQNVEGLKDLNGQVININDGVIVKKPDYYKNLTGLSYGKVISVSSARAKVQYVDGKSVVSKTMDPRFIMVVGKYDKVIMEKLLKNKSK